MIEFEGMLLLKEIVEGVKFLDNAKPDWPWDVVKDWLNMSNPRDCILGQLYADSVMSCDCTCDCYDVTCDSGDRCRSGYGYAVRHVLSDDQDPSELGFSVDDTCTFEQLNVYWTQVIESRRTRS